MMENGFKKWLQDRFGEQVRWDESLAGHTSFRVGGPAEAYVSVTDAAALRELVRKCSEAGVAYFILAGGTNLLVKDGGLNGVVIDVKKGLKEITRLASSEKGAVQVAAGAGVNLQAMCRYAIKNGLAGLNFALGIPGTVGGAVVMNAGTAQGVMADVIVSLKFLTAEGRFLTRSKDQLEFDYRGMTRPELADDYHRPLVIVEAVLSLSRSDSETVRREADAILKERLQLQPTSAWSAGCFFKNPPGGESAGKLIERAGLKGQTVGGAAVSERHANFIVNTGQARAADILALMEIVRTKVADTFGVELEPEVKIVGE